MGRKFLLSRSSPSWSSIRSACQNIPLFFRFPVHATWTSEHFCSPATSDVSVPPVSSARPDLSARPRLPLRRAARRCSACGAGGRSCGVGGPEPATVEGRSQWKGVVFGVPARGPLMQEGREREREIRMHISKF